jgi:hypothetical protein
MKRFLLRSMTMGGIALAIFPISAWANGEGSGASAAIKVSTGSNVEGTGSIPLVKPPTGEDLAEQRKQEAIATEAQQKKEAVEEVNALIVDSYKALLDKILNQLYANIAEASRGNRSAQIDTLSKVRDNLVQKLDALEEQNITPNRKKILQGIYFYLKSSVESRIQGLQE